MTGVTKAVVCITLSVGCYVAVAGFLSRYLSGPLPYVCRHIT